MWEASLAEEASEYLQSSVHAIVMCAHTFLKCACMELLMACHVSREHISLTMTSREHISLTMTSRDMRFPMAMSFMRIAKVCML